MVDFPEVDTLQTYTQIYRCTSVFLLYQTNDLAKNLLLVTASKEAF